MNMDQVRMMKREGMEFGIHDYDHYWMKRLKKEELREDIGTALNVFGDVVNGGRWVCCYPYGSYSDEVINQVFEMGRLQGCPRMWEPTYRGSMIFLEFQGWIQMISRPKVGNIRNINKSPGICPFCRR